MYCNRRACHSDAIDINKSLSKCTIIHNNSHNHISQLIQSYITIHTIIHHNLYTLTSQFIQSYITIHKIVYGVAANSRLLQIIRLFCKRAL